MTEELAARDNSGKPELHFAATFHEALNGAARVSTYGSKKYALYNYTKGAPASQSFDCALRHLLKWWNGEDLDDESGLSHLDHFVWNAMRLAHEMATRPELDDRPKLIRDDTILLSSSEVAERRRELAAVAPEPMEEGPEEEEVQYAPHWEPKA